MTEIRDVLKPEFIQLQLRSIEKQKSIIELIDLFMVKNIVKNKDKYLKAVLKREEEHTTGIGFGVAIPHGKSKSVSQPAVAFGRSKKGINYNSIDGKPVYLMFLIAVPENSNDEHLRILSKLSRKLMHEEVRTKLMNADTTEDIYQIFE